LIPIVWFAKGIREYYIVQSTTLVQYLGVVMVLLGLLLGKISIKWYDLREFMGLQQLQPVEIKNMELQTKGMLRYVRHPLYLATLIIVIGILMFSLTITNLVSASVIILYLFVGIYLEERKLIHEFGKDYRDYKKKTPMLFPRLKLFKTNL
jgi:methanethiol S-methyltransferase